MEAYLTMTSDVETEPADAPSQADRQWWDEETRSDDWEISYRFELGPEPDFEPEPADDTEPDSWFDTLYADRLDDGWPTDEDCCPGLIG